MGFFWKQTGLKTAEGILDLNCRELREAAENYYVRRLAFSSCVNLIAAALARSEFRTWRNGEEVRDKHYYCWNVQPNVNQNSTLFLHKLVSVLYEKNEALIVRLPDAPASPAPQNLLQLFAADDWSLEPPDGYPGRMNAYTNVRVDEVTYRKTLLESDVLHLKLYHCDVQPVIRGICDAFSELLSAAAQNYKWTNGQHWKVHVNQMASGQEGWAKAFQEIMDRQIRPFLSSGYSVLPELDGYAYENVSKPTENSRDAGHIRNLVNDVFDFTANAFLIPPVLLRGQVEGTADAVQRFLTSCVDPLADQIGEEFTRKYYEFEGWKRGGFLRVDTSAIQHFNLFENAANVEKLIGSGYSYNDVQRATGGQTLSEPWADKHFFTKNFDLAENFLKPAGEGGTS